MGYDIGELCIYMIWHNNRFSSASIQERLTLDEHSRRGPKPIRKPLDRWRKTVEAQMEQGQNILVHVCPLHRDGSLV